MSSLAAARADNFYYPPDWDPNSGSEQARKAGGKNAKHGSLGARANKSSQGILVIRFEMPFNVWCDGCNHLIAKGVRFNAEKKHHGNYFSTKVWSFKMLSPCCQTAIEVRTDPKTTEYLVISGARRKVEEYDAEAAGSAVLPSPAEREAINSNPFARLENGQIDKAKALGERERLALLHADNEDKHGSGNDYKANKALRRRLRTLRKEAKALDAHRDAIGVNEAVKLLPHCAEDSLVASATQFDVDSRFQRSLQHRRRAVQGQSIFSASASYKPRAGKPSGSAAQRNPQHKPSNTGRLQLLAKRRRMDASLQLTGR